MTNGGNLSINSRAVGCGGVARGEGISNDDT